jgi:uncharacterized protein DUF4255
MFIRVIDEGLERFLRAQLPLPEDMGDISFDIPSSTWAAGLSRITVNFYLYDVNRSNHPNRAPMRRETEDGKYERRKPLPMVELNYLISAWAGNPRDEHQLLGDVLARIASVDVLPTEHLPTQLSSSVSMVFAEDERHKTRDIWNGAGGALKASFSLKVVAAADSFDWSEEPPAPTMIEARSGWHTAPPKPTRGTR